MARIIIAMEKYASLSAGASGFKKDERVMVQLEGKWYVGTVKRAGAKVHVAYDNGEEDALDASAFQYIKSLGDKFKKTKQSLTNTQAKAALKLVKTAAQTGKPIRSVRTLAPAPKVVDTTPQQQTEKESKNVAVGYWAQNKSAHNKPYPWPEANTGGGSPTGLKQLEEEECGRPRGQYRGFSKCRICKKPNGTGDFEYTSKTTGKTYTWPQGLRHYFSAHKVAVPKEVRELLKAYKADKAASAKPKRGKR